MSIAPGATGSTSTNLVVRPCDGATAASITGVPYGFLILGAGQFSSSITPSGSGKTPVVRAYPKFKAPSTLCKDSVGSYTVGVYLYVAGGADAGKYTITPTSNMAGAIPVGICTHKPTAAEPWLGVAAVI